MRFAALAAPAVCIISAIMVRREYVALAFVVGSGFGKLLLGVLR
jgi:hypothetical protein